MNLEKFNDGFQSFKYSSQQVSYNHKTSFLSKSNNFYLRSGPLPNFLRASRFRDFLFPLSFLYLVLKGINEALDHHIERLYRLSFLKDVFSCHFNRTAFSLFQFRLLPNYSLLSLQAEEVHNLPSHLFRFDFPFYLKAERNLILAKYL